MDIKNNHEKLLIIIALIFCAGILFYNAFFIPDISIPSIIYVDSATDENSEDGDKVTEDSSSDSNLSANDINEKVNINTATVEELDEKLVGIGPSTAQKIVEYRNSVGKFYSIEEIMNVSGIGEKTFEKFKDMICV